MILRNKFNLIFLLIFEIISCRALALAKYPVASDLKGMVSYREKNKDFIRLKKGTTFKKYAFISTGEKSQVKIEVDPDTTLLLNEKSELEIPTISFEEGEVSDIFLVKGELRVQSRKQNQRYYSTLISHQMVSNADFILSFNQNEMKTRLFVFSGVLDFGGTEGEEQARVRAHEKTTFTGVIEDGKPGFDVLLGGRKVAKGRLGVVEAIPAAELSILEKSLSIEKMKVEALLKTKASNVKIKNQICDKPAGRLNDCSWACKKWDKKKKFCLDDCVRRRCNANGNWADVFVDKSLQSRCGPSVLVEPCNY